MFNGNYLFTICFYSLVASWYQFQSQKSGFQRKPCSVLHFSGVLYSQMRPPTKQASKFRSTAKTNHRSLISWDLVWPLVFKHLCHVSSNWYLMFSLLPSNLHFSLLSFNLSPPPPDSRQPGPIASICENPEQNQAFGFKIFYVLEHIYYMYTQLFSRYILVDCICRHSVDILSKRAAGINTK